MKKIYRVLALIFAVCTVLSVFAGCEKGSVDDTTPAVQTSGEPEVTEAPPSAELIKDGKLKVNIIRGENATQTEIDAAVQVRKTLVAKYPDGDVTISDDFTGMQNYDPEKVEILVGVTSFPETQAVLDGLKYGDAAIRTVGHKIVVVSRVETAYNTLSNRLFETLLAQKDPANVTFDESADYLMTVNKSLNAIPVLSGLNPDRITGSGDKAYQLFYTGATAEILDGYVKTLKEEGFETVTDNEVNGSRFTVSLNADTAVTAYFEKPYSYIRIMTEPRSNYCETKEEPFTAVTTPILTMIGRRFSDTTTYLGCDAGAGLLCMMIRLSDGRFIVVDGGGTAAYATALYAKMLEQSPDKKPVIAAWFLTHSHSDHIGGVNQFIQSYSAKVPIERILLNFPNDTDMQANSDSEFSLWQAARSNISQYYPTTPVYKIHTGQNYTFADAKIEVHYTQEDYLNKKRSVNNTANNWNNTSAIFSVSIAGQKIMFLGDSQEDPNNMTAKIWGDRLKSDIVQVAHHGGIGGTRAIYNAVDADVALFTTTDVLVPVYINKWDYNYHLVANLHLKEYFNSCDRITTFKLPYTPKSSGFVKTTDN